MSKVQIIICKCGNIIAACAEPYCYESSQWLKDVRRHKKEGRTIELQDKNSVKFEKCTCNE